MMGFVGKRFVNRGPLLPTNRVLKVLARAGPIPLVKLGYLASESSDEEFATAGYCVLAHRQLYFEGDTHTCS